jgi:site-specific DNA recombinase
MEAAEADLKRQKRRYEGHQQTRNSVLADLVEEWEKPDFTMEQKQAATARILAAVIIKPAGMGQRFPP